MWIKIMEVRVTRMVLRRQNLSPAMTIVSWLFGSLTLLDLFLYYV